MYRNISTRAMLQRLPDLILSEGKRRFLFPCGVVLGLKLLVAWTVYALATYGDRAFATFWMKEWGIQPEPDWPFLFHGWDSAWYIRIAKTGYSYPAYAFFPAYPFLIRVASGVIGEYFISSFTVSFVLGVLAIPMFQLLAEHYMSKNEAAVATLLFALFPPVFLFTSIAYTESLFTIAILGTWIFCLRRHYSSATAFATIATVTKVYGLLISLPLAIRLFREKKMKDLFLALTVPSIAFLGWNIYLLNLTEDWDAYRSSQSYWQKGWPFGISSILRFIVESRLAPIRNAPRPRDNTSRHPVFTNSLSLRSLGCRLDRCGQRFRHICDAIVPLHSHLRNCLVIPEVSSFHSAHLAHWKNEKTIDHNGGDPTFPDGQCGHLVPIRCLWGMVRIELRLRYVNASRFGNPV